MAAPSLTYTLTNGSTADATQVMQDLNDILNGVTDGTKDLSISALTCAGTATFNGAVTLGNASGDDITITGSVASSIAIKTDDAFDIGSSSLRLNQVFAHEYYGTKTNDSATSGFIGELVESQISVSTNAAATNTFLALASISLDPGDWDICASVMLSDSGATFNNNDLEIVVGSSTGSSLGSVVGYSRILTAQNPTFSSNVAATIPRVRVSLASTTVYYLNVLARYSAGTPQWRGSISARRRR
jgi:hypothetical protein